MKLEIACYNYESAVLAEKAGADRIELCDNYFEGGTTPSYGTISLTVKRLKIPVNIIIRPRGGNFIYTDDEFEIMKEDIKIAKEIKANGIVIGLLNKKGEVDFERTKELIELAKPLEITFHRAFDVTNDPFKALDDLINLGVDRILTSGTEKTAEKGIKLISELIKKAGNRITIMPGSGIRENNIQLIARKTGATEFHSSAMTFIKKDNLSGTNVNIGSSENDESMIVSVDQKVISGMKDKLTNL